MALANRPSPGLAAGDVPLSALTAAFERHERALTIGVEEELMLLDPLTHDLLPTGPEVVGRAADVRVRTELPAAQVELVTPVCGDTASLHRALLGGRRRLLEATGGRARPAGAGTHPFAAAEGPLSPGERYEAISQEYQWAARRGLAWGLHVHVAVPGAQRALAVHDALREWLPLVAALAGNSPFHEGCDTGLHAVRPKIAEGFPRQGVAPAWGTWEAYASFLEWSAAPGKSALDASRDLWWEVRLHPVHGTIEVRVCDQPATARVAAALAAVIQALCGTLAARHDAGELPPPMSRERIEENRWRALRHGLEGSLLGLDGPGPRPTLTLAAQLLADLAPMAERCGSLEQLVAAEDLLSRTGSTEQRELAEKHGIREVARILADRFEDELR